MHRSKCLVPLTLLFKKSTGRDEVQISHKRASFARAILAIHIRILKLDREGTLVVHFVERPDDCFEINRTATRRTKVPVAARVAEREVTAKASGRRWSR